MKQPRDKQILDRAVRLALAKARELSDADLIAAISEAAETDAAIATKSLKQARAELEAEETRKHLLRVKLKKGAIAAGIGFLIGVGGVSAFRHMKGVNLNLFGIGLMGLGGCGVVLSIVSAVGSYTNHSTQAEREKERRRESDCFFRDYKARMQAEKEKKRRVSVEDFFPDHIFRDDSVLPDVTLNPERKGEASYDWNETEIAWIEKAGLQDLERLKRRYRDCFWPKSGPKSDRDPLDPSRSPEKRQQVIEKAARQFDLSESDAELRIRRNEFLAEKAGSPALYWQ